MGKTLVVMILTIGILLGGFYLFFYQKDTTVVVNEVEDDTVISEELAASDESTDDNEEKSGVDTTNWLDYQYMTKQLVFTTKYPSSNWQTVEQEHEEEFNLIFTNGDSCQVVYTFDLEGEAYNFDLANNNDDDVCAAILQKIIAYASVPKFGIAAASLYEDEEIEEAEEAEEEDGVLVEEDQANQEDEEQVDELEQEENVNEEEGDDDQANQEDEDEDEAEAEEEDTTVIEEKDPSAGISDQEIMEMSEEDRYDMVKEFVHEYLLEYAKRHWDYVESKLSAKAKKELGSDNLADIVNTYYYYEVLNFISPISETQYTTTVKLTDKEEEPIGEGSGVYKLNIVWENGEWKIDNYLFE